ncbi:hypothetical protein [Acinetobacter bohemicus]|uniref:hypothetical protein n=1 Tax=Acinetobacter bohemicus TaxID=1435036 RepID=UPI00192BD9F6|nr:hypothetical protein [Acinetobacter bohemicus]CAD9193986.1 hypothetical protein QAC21B_00071 [Acinetobacter bohemicus]
MSKNEMIAGMMAVGTRINGQQTLSEAQATLLVQDHISVSTLCQCEQNKVNHQPENDCSDLPHPTSSLCAQKEQGDLAGHLQPIHPQEQSKPILTTQSVILGDRFCMDSHS